MRFTIFSLLLCLISNAGLFAQAVPLPEHPNPIKKRAQWINLNGEWNFRFDRQNNGLDNDWASGAVDFNQKITVPFPWGSELSGVADEADIGWYQRTITVPAGWQGKRTFLIIGAADWETHVWLDGKLLGRHQGGYIPFEFELTDHLQYDRPMRLVIRVDDARRMHTLYGKQGYGNARGIWQTPYLEARGDAYIEDLHVTPDIDKQQVRVTAYLPEPVNAATQVALTITGEGAPIEATIPFFENQSRAEIIVPLPEQRLWTLDDPYLYDIEASRGDDVLQSYFGMRKISTAMLPGTDIPYIALNNEPVYLQMALDQSYHPEGYYTFPSDQFMIDEIKRSKSIGLNGIRTHIKVEIPRKLYWADKLGLLVMEDLPNSWGEPEEAMQKESTYTLREMIKRDYNHPAIFSWVLFNETWGLRSTTADEERVYLPETQKWVVSMYHLAKSLDPSRLVEDNSICCGIGHTVTDINSWHVYLPGYAWDEYLSNLSDSTFIGSGFNYEEGYRQGAEPNFNSECGNVWGYEGSAGDVDWSWDYHRMINSFRTHPKIAGWLYTEHHDVINEWNGYWRFDRSEKYTGLGDIVPGMRLNDLHASIYVSTGQEICFAAKAGENLEIPLFLSSMDERAFPGGLVLELGVSHLNEIGETGEYEILETRPVKYRPWMQEKLAPLQFTVPPYNGVATVRIILKTNSGEILHRNFAHVVIEEGRELEDTQIASVAAKDYSGAEWSRKTWDAMDGKKVNGAGDGFFEYTIELSDLDLASAEEAFFLMEASAKELFVKDREAYDTEQDFMKGSRVAPSSNPNAYPMTDETRFPSEIKIYVNGREVKTMTLPDDPADHRGVLSWFAQKKDRKLREAGSYGYLIKIPLGTEAIAAIRSEGKLKVRIESVNGGGLAVYGAAFGRYPFDPSLVVKR